MSKRGGDERSRSLLASGVQFYREAFSKPALPENKFRLKDFVFFSQFARPVWKLALISFILAFSMTILKSIMPLAGKVFIDFIVMKQGYGEVGSILSTLGLGSLTDDMIQFLGSMDMIVLSMIVGSLIFGGLGAIQGYTAMRYGQEITFNLQKSLFERAFRFPVSVFKTRQAGYITQRILGDVNTMRSLYANTMVNVFSNLFLLVVGAMVMFFMSPTMTLIILCISPLYLIISLYFPRRIRSMNYRIAETSSQFARDINEAFSGVEVVKTNTAEDREVEKVSGKMREIIQINIKNMVITSASNSLMSIVQFSIVVVIMWFGYGEIAKGTMTLGDFAAFSAYAYLLSGALSNTFSTYNHLQAVMATMDRLKELFSIEQEYEPGKDNGKLKPARVEGNIRFEHVSFAYQVDKPVLEDVSFEAKVGETLVFVGPSGAGKTTIANLLLKFYMPQSGAIYLDGNNLQDIDTPWLRSQIGVVSQDIFLFDDTILNNIRYGMPSATEEEIIDAAKKANIHDDIIKLSDGYQTVVGDRGAKLSTGQRQRVSIARAFLKNTPILLLDEPTSALDMETEGKINESFSELDKGKTVFIISHRTTMTILADKVLVINNGKNWDDVQRESHPLRSIF